MHGEDVYIVSIEDVFIVSIDTVFPWMLINMSGLDGREPEMTQLKAYQEKK